MKMEVTVKVIDDEMKLEKCVVTEVADLRGYTSEQSLVFKAKSVAGDIASNLAKVIFEEE